MEVPVRLLNYKFMFWGILVSIVLLASVFFVLGVPGFFHLQGGKLVQLEARVKDTCGEQRRLWDEFQKKYPDPGSANALESKDWADMQSWEQACIQALDDLKEFLIKK